MIDHKLTGKGFYLWNLPDCEMGDSEEIASVAAEANLSHALVKIADGTKNYMMLAGADLLSKTVAALKRRSITVWGWHYCYGFDPLGEAKAAIAALQALDLAGYVIDAEEEYKTSGAAHANIFLEALRPAQFGIPVALSSYRYPSYHPTFPWEQFIAAVDMIMPQVYWLFASNAGEQLARSYREYQSLAPNLPFVATGAAWRQGTWSVTPAQATEFLVTAKSLGLPAVNFWEWAHCRNDLPDTWSAITGYRYDGQPAPGPQPSQPAIEMINLVAGLRIRTSPSVASTANIIGSLAAGANLQTIDLYEDARGVWVMYPADDDHPAGYSAAFYDGKQYMRRA